MQDQERVEVDERMTDQPEDGDLDGVDRLRAHVGEGHTSNDGGEPWVAARRQPIVTGGMVEWTQTDLRDVDASGRAGRRGSVVAMGTGLGLLVLYAATEVLANPGLTLADGYWIGRLPWTAIGIALAVLGATGVIIFGTVLHGSQVEPSAVS